MAGRDVDVEALADAMQAAFPDRWEALLAAVDDRYEPEEEPRKDHYAWISELVDAVLDPAIEAGDASMCSRVLAFSLPLHGTTYGDAVQHRVLRYACRPEVRARLRGLVEPDLLGELAALCISTDNGT